MKYRVGDKVKYSEEAHQILRDISDYDHHTVVKVERELVVSKWDGETSLYQHVEFDNGDGCDAGWVVLVERASIFKSLMIRGFLFFDSLIKKL